MVNVSILRLSLGCVLGSVLGGPSLHAAGYGFDAGQSPTDYVRSLDQAHVAGQNGMWVRIRGLAGSGGEGDHAGRTQVSDRQALQELHTRGVCACVVLRWSPSDWKTGVRAGGGQRYPLDLREAYERGRRLGEAYGDLVDVWEIENEPDIDFVAENPETHAAFQKAVYFGLHAGVQSEAKSLELRVESSYWRTRKLGRSDLNLKLLPSTRGASSRRASPRVVMAPLALPPGPYFERLWANGLASYTDGFNFHYYGYAEDFTGVYRQFEDAVGRQAERESRVQWLESRAQSPESRGGGQESRAQRLGSRVGGQESRVQSPESRDTATARFRVSQLSALSSRLEPRKRLPIFITEYGYGLLDAEARDTVEGRVRQWRWFASLAEQIRTLRPEGPMAFLLNPYYEAGLNEFGLTMKPTAGFMAVASSEQRVAGMKAKGIEIGADSEFRVQSLEFRDKSEELISASSSEVRSSPLAFRPTDFGVKSSLPWMARIGQKVGEGYASPALAYLWDYAERHPYQARDWTVQAAPPSPVVIDFIADRDLVQMKRSGGYAVRGVSVEWSPVSERFGKGRLVLYNLGATPVSGEWVITDPSVVVAVPAAAMTLARGERREVPIEVRVPGDVWKPRTLGVRFVPTGPAAGAAVFSTQLYPDAAELEITPVAGFEFAPESTRARSAALQARPLAVGEPALRPDGRWLVTDGVRVEERDGVWRFHIDHLPEEPLRPASVELPLPTGFVFESGSALMLERRIGRRPEIGNLPQAKKPETGNLKPEIDPSSENSGLSPQVSSAESSGLGSASALNSQLSTLNPQLASAARRKPRAGVAGDMMDVYFRTENGNLYQTWPRLRVGESWTRYLGQADDFTMGFFGRAALPWRFVENRPAALVFFLRTSQVPAVFEVRSARIVRLGAGGQ